VESFDVHAFSLPIIPRNVDECGLFIQLSRWLIPEITPAETLFPGFRRPNRSLLAAWQPASRGLERGQWTRLNLRCCTDATQFGVFRPSMEPATPVLRLSGDTASKLNRW